MARPNDLPCTKCGHPMRGPKARASGMCHTCRMGRDRNKLTPRIQSSSPPPDWPCIPSRDRVSCATVLDPDLPWHAEVIEHAKAMMHDAITYAHAQGHDMTLAVRDVDPGTWLALCHHCHGYVVVDPIESAEPYGLAYTRPCPRTVYQPALRRNLLDYAPANASASQEPADRDPMYILED